MTKQQLRALEVGDRVENRTLAGRSIGEVVGRSHHRIVIEWKCGGGTWVMCWRSHYDQRRAECIAKLD
jgi:hypothetical protein